MQDPKWREENVGATLQKELKQHMREKHPEKKVRVNKSGCLGKCRMGVNAVIYPEGEWISQLNLEDIDKIKRELINE